MTRIPAVTPSEAGPLIKVAYKFAARQYDEVPEPVAVLANHRKLFVAAAGHQMAVPTASKVLPSHIRDMAIYRVAWTAGCSWGFYIRTTLSRLAGLDVKVIKGGERGKEG